MKTLKIIKILLFVGYIIPAQAQLYAPEINVQAMPNNRVELNSDLYLMDAGANPAAYITRSGNAQLKVLDISHSGDNSFMRFQTPFQDKKAMIGMQDDGDDGFFVRVNGVYRMYVNMSGNVAIGRAIASEKLHVNGNVLASNVSVTSDEKLKQDIQEYNEGLAVVKQINPKKYKYKPRKEKRMKESADPTQTEEVMEEEILVTDDREYVGVVAQELQSVAPDLVGSFLDEEGSETLTVNQTALTFLLINAVKELSAQVDELQLALEEKEKK